MKMSPARSTSLNAKIGATDDFANTYQYDALSRLTSIEQTSQTGGNAVSDKRVNLAYNAAGQFSTINRYRDLAGTQLVASSTNTYDSLGRLTNLRHANSANATLAQYTWTFDTLSRVTSLTSNDGTSTYSYDATSQLTAADYSYQTDENYSLDANGNRTNTGYTTGTNNRLLSDGTFNYAYDPEGNRSTRTRISSAAASDYLTEYKWDYRNRLTNVTFKNNAGTVTKSVQYTYDVFDRRISKQVDDNGNGTFDRSEQFVYDGEDIALRFVDADGDGAQASSLANRYLHGPEVDQVFADEQFDAAGQLSNVLWPLADNLGTVRDLANNTGVIVNHRLFDAFGRITGETDPSIDHAFAYTGREWDGDAQLYYYRARWYDAAVGRFISEDPIGFSAGDENLSRYVGNSPTNSRDPSGLAEESWHHTLVKQWLRNNGFIDKHGNTTSKVTGGKLNVHSKEFGVMVPPENHTQRPDGIHCKDSDGGTTGMTYDKHFAEEVQRRMKNGTISIDDLKAAGKATVAKYPKQTGSAPAATNDYPNKRPLVRRSRTGSAHMGTVGGIGMVASQLIVQGINHDALEAYESGDKTRCGYAYGKALDESYTEQDYHKRVVLGQDPDVEALPWWRRMLRKMSSSMTMSHDAGAFMR